MATKRDDKDAAASARSRRAKKAAEVRTAKIRAHEPCPDLGPSMAPPGSNGKSGRQRGGDSKNYPNPLRTPENRAAMLEAFQRGATWRQVANMLRTYITPLQAWVASDPELREEYRAAKEIGADFVLDGVHEAVESLEEPDIMRREDGTVDVLATEAMARARAATARSIIEGRKIIASMRAPKRFGNKVQHTGEGDDPIRVVVTSYAEASKDDE